DFFTLSNMADYVIVGILSKMDIGQLKDIFNTAFKNPTSKQRAAIWLKGLDSKMQAKILE
ncbi:MAG: hypothetical protein JW734_00555, partial [Candidatus Omnitrophica bacterium]|nr:hypothetical protein [Candidatus Omnitrophota bacterium]